jgi:hypothetical protein
MKKPKRRSFAGNLRAKRVVLEAKVRALKTETSYLEGTIKDLKWMEKHSKTKGP